MRWLTNGHGSQAMQCVQDLQAGHTRHVLVGDPKPGKYSVSELQSMGYNGYYEIGTCQCDLCKEQRRKAYYKPLEDWRKMNEQILEQKEAERRAAIRAEHTYPPITRRIVLDMGVDQETKLKICAFVGSVISNAEYANLLGYAMHIKRSEEPETDTTARQVYYDLLIDVDVSPTVEVALTELIGHMHQIAHDRGLVGNGLKIMRMV